MTFQEHPSKDLLELFRNKPYQGQSPEDAKIIFLSLDANYSEEISNHSFFKYILEYQKDSILFWEKYGVHHPFLLKEYPFNRNAGGVPFHYRFSRLGLDSKYANNISFLELLDLPTIGNSSGDNKVFNSLVDINHLKYIDSIIQSDRQKLILIPDRALKRMMDFQKRFSVFKWLNYSYSIDKTYFYNINSNKVIKIYHFSSSQIYNQLPEIRNLIDNWIKK